MKSLSRFLKPHAQGDNEILAKLNQCCNAVLIFTGTWHKKWNGIDPCRHPALDFSSFPRQKQNTKEERKKHLHEGDPQHNNTM
jgi:hypothetical protein